MIGKASSSDMKFLLVGGDSDALIQLKDIWGRAQLQGEWVPSLESAYFDILQGSVAAVFVDLRQIALQPATAIEDMLELDQDLEVVLITPPGQADSLPFSMLRQCYSVMESPLTSQRNRLLLLQLTQKLTLKKTIKVLQDTSNLDGLTHLFNHAYIQRYLDREVPEMLVQNVSISLIFIDIDHFKAYNDQNGHPQGDRVLVQLAEILSASVRQFDVIGRYGGEEFVIILPGTSLKVGIKIAERCRRRIAQTDFPHGERQPLGCVSASFGVSSLSANWVQSKRELIRTADQALYRAKGDGRNCVWFFRKGRYRSLRHSPHDA